MSKNLEFALTILFAAIILNIELPFTLIGFSINVQRLTTLWVFLIYCIHVILEKRKIQKIKVIQIKITFFFIIIILIDLLHGVNGNGVGTIQLILNIILFNLTSFLFLSLNQKQFQRFVFFLLPLCITIVCLFFLYDFNFGNISDGTKTFFTGYRLRADEQRNIINVWAGGLSLLPPLLTIPILSGRGKIIEVIMSILATMLLTAVVASTFSRSALLIIILSFVFLTLLWMIYYKGKILIKRTGNNRQLLQNFLLLSLLLLFGYILFSNYLNTLNRLWHLRLETLHDRSVVNDASLSWRIKALSKTAELFIDAPIFGHGQSARHTLRGAFENTYAYILAQWGIVGLFSFLGIFLSTLKLTFRKLRKKREIYGLVGFTIILSYMILGMTNEYVTFPVGMFLLSLITTINNTGYSFYFAYSNKKLSKTKNNSISK